jgi:glycosyltransferase involved in cell wall biosynthesis
VNLAFVVQRYGADIAGGSEAHCRELAERMTRRHAVTVLTTCARDYVTWANALAEGETEERGVRVRRFRVTRTRRLKAFADLSDEVFAGPSPRRLQDDWFRENGPQAPDLLEHLRASGRLYDAALFWTFRYYPSYFGAPLVADRAILVPTAEEDRAIDLDVLRDFFRLPAGYIFLTPEEEALVSTRAARSLRPSTVIGSGLEPRSPLDAEPLLARHGITGPYVLYLGRVDRNKGCDTLLEYYQAFADTAGAPPLLLAGPTTMRIPEHPGIRALGYVPAELREALLAHARVLIVPSPYESLCLALLEAWNHGVPALVNGRCRVLHGQVRRANGGLFYRSGQEFQEALSHLLSVKADRDALGRQGLAYVEREYRWPTVLGRVETLLADVVAARTPERP